MKIKKPRTIFSVLGIVLLSFSNALAFDIYWTTGLTGQVQATNYDGSGTSTLLTFGVTMRGIDLLPSANKLYVAGNDRILYADLDGSNMNQFFVTGLTAAQGLAVDRVNSKIYFSSASGISRIDVTTGTTITPTLVTSSGGSTEAIALDVANQHIYFLEESDDSLRRIGFDGTGETTLVTAGNLFNPEGLSLDLANQFIYVVNQGAASNGNIVRYDFSGNFIDTVVSNVPTAGPEGVAASSAQGKIYFTASDGGGQIRSADLDGSNLNNTFVTGLGAADVQQIALVPEPRTYALIAAILVLGLAVGSRAFRHRKVIASE